MMPKVQDELKLLPIKKKNKLTINRNIAHTPLRLTSAHEIRQCRIHKNDFQNSRPLSITDTTTYIYIPRYTQSGCNCFEGKNTHPHQSIDRHNRVVKHVKREKVKRFPSAHKSVLRFSACAPRSGVVHTSVT